MTFKFKLMALWVWTLTIGGLGWQKDWSYHEYHEQRKVGEKIKLGPHRVLWGKSPTILDFSLDTAS